MKKMIKDRKGKDQEEVLQSIRELMEKNHCQGLIFRDIFGILSFYVSYKTYVLVNCVFEENYHLLDEVDT